MKYPHLTNQQLVTLLGKVRIMNFENYPPEFNDVDVPYGHDLIDTIKERLLPARVVGLVEVDLNFLFRNNHDLRTYITGAIGDLEKDGVPLDRPVETVVDEILQYIEDQHMVMSSLEHTYTLYVSPVLSNFYPVGDWKYSGWIIFVK